MRAFAAAVARLSSGRRNAGYPTVAILWLAFTGELSAAAPKEVTYSSECSCEGDHGVQRWRAKTDPSEPPPRAADIIPITPSEIYQWVGPGIIPHGGRRTGNELRFFSLTGRVIAMQVENDGDVHIVLVNAEDERPGKVIVEIPLGARWCALRTMAFSWTNAAFPFTTNGQFSTFQLIHKPVITVIGKAFYDTDHSGKDIRNNRRPRDKTKAVWEIHPVMKMEVRKVDVGATDAQKIAPAPSPPARATVPVLAPPSIPAASEQEQLVTIIKAVAIKIPYGETVLQPGTRLPLVSRDATNVQVRYLGEIQSIPISATDL